jgi:hypothetical protein
MVWIVLLVALLVGVLAARVLLRRARSFPRARPSSKPAAPEIDPFEILALQLRLSTLATQIQRIEHDETSLARAHHLRATQYAYDAILRQACLLVGLDDQSRSPATDELVSDTWVVDEDERMRQELELCARGWSW